MPDKPKPLIDDYFNQIQNIIYGALGNTAISDEDMKQLVKRLIDYLIFLVFDCISK